ncbi:MAG: pitrilysin family protein [Acidimicrobiia bacterium]
MSPVQVLSNGLRVVALPDSSSPVVAVSVLYDVGFRSEPEGRSGFAHLFEHMMFQGSKRVPKGEFDRLVLGNGGVENGMTTPDYTAYYEVLPSTAIDLALFLEADRMHSLVLDQENLDNQRAVVQEEIRLNVLNRPYGKFPWIQLPELMFDTYPNAHDGYGSFEDLDAADLADIKRFFRRFYTPANAVLSLCGDVDPEETFRMAERHFGGIGGGRRPRRPSFAEPIADGVRRGEVTDPFAPAPALALGYRVPDPIRDLGGVLALDIFGTVLTDGVASRLERRLVQRDGLVTAVDAWIGESPGWGGPFEMRDPTRFQISTHYPRLQDGDQIVRAIDEEVERAIGTLSQEEVDRSVTKTVATHTRKMDHVLNRALLAAGLVLLHGDLGLLEEIPRRYERLNAEEIAATAGEWIRQDRRSDLRLLPGGDA